MKILPVYGIEQYQYLGTACDFYANTLTSHFTQHHHFILTPHRHSHYISVLVNRGSGIYQIDFTNYEITPGSVFLLAPGQVHNVKPSEDIEGYVFFHTRDFYDLNYINNRIDNFPFFSCIPNPSVIFLKNEASEKIESIYREIVEEYQQNKLMKFRKLCALVNILYIELSRVYLPVKQRVIQNESYLFRLRKLEDLVETNFKSLKYPKDYAQFINVSDKHLNRICKTCLNKTTSQLITDRIILEAKRMLVFSKYSVCEIAEELGYTDTSYFFRLFKKKTGVTPLEFLNKYRED
ncbi:MAG: transcriptional regulator, AraC family [Segetibacter sp.]|nr:transcriptional regulator, AraC family [Segetibacter sp.]